MKGWWMVVGGLMTKLLLFVRINVIYAKNNNILCIDLYVFYVLHPIYCIIQVHATYFYTKWHGQQQQLVKIVKEHHVDSDANQSYREHLKKRVLGIMRIT